MMSFKTTKDIDKKIKVIQDYYRKINSIKLPKSEIIRLSIASKYDELMGITNE